MTTTIWAAESGANTTTTGDQRAPSVGVLADGTYVIAWLDGTGPEADVVARRFAADGQPMGAEFVVAADVGAQAQPTVMAAFNGGFVVGFLDDGAVAAVRYDEWGEVSVTYPDNAGASPRENLSGVGLIDLPPDAGTPPFVQVFLEDGALKQLRQYSAAYVEVDGVAGPEFAGGPIQDFDVAALSGGLHAIAFSTAQGVYAVTYAPGGYSIGYAVLSESPALADQPEVAVAGLVGGDYVATWRTTSAGTIDLVGQVYSISGTPRGSGFTIKLSQDQVSPKLVGLQDGGFALLWIDDADPWTTGNTDNIIRGQLFDNLGNKTGGVFTVSTEAGVRDSGVEIGAAVLADGRFVVTWESEGADGQGYGVQSAIIDPRDGQVSGDATSEALYGGGLADVITGQGGDDTVEAGDGADSVYGGAGDDLILGQGGNDRLFGSSGSDAMAGGTGDDLIQGGLGDDTLSGGLGADTLDGGDGFDAVAYLDAARVNIDLVTGVHRAGAAGDAIVSAEVFYLSNGSDRFVGLEGSETVYGGGGSDLVQGRGGDDVLWGHDGGDTLNGGDGEDRLEGGLGADKLIGGAGADRFVFSAVDDSSLAGGVDRIGGFSAAAGDRLDLRNIDAVAGTPDDDAFVFVNAFSGAAGELRVTIDGAANLRIVEGDVNGDGLGDFVLELAGTGALTADAFLL